MIRCGAEGILHLHLFGPESLETPAAVCGVPLPDIASSDIKVSWHSVQLLEDM